MTCRDRCCSLLLLAACGPTVGGDASSDSDGDDPAELDCASIPEGAYEARLVTGRGTPTIEMLEGPPGDDAPPFGCDDAMPRCGYVLSRLVPLDDIAPGTFTVAEGTLDHSGEFCSCCNGEDGGADENFGTFEEPEAVLVLEGVAEACVAGYYQAQREITPFVAERCEF
jgi:hypothetical protein